jgi:hypothetical protein
MRYDGQARSLDFGSHDELLDFHAQLGSLIRMAMVLATRRIEDPAAAKQESKLVMQRYAVLMRTLNVLRASLPRKQF